MEEIEKIILKLDSTFPEVYFDIDVELINDYNIRYCIFVSDLQFYLYDKKFKKIVEILRNKYKSTKFYCCCLPNKFKEDE